MTQIVDPSTLSPTGWYVADSVTSGYIASWTDSSTMGADLINTTTDQQPIAYPSIRNGLKGLLFDGSNDYLYSTGAVSTFLSTAGVGTVMAVVAQSGGFGGIWGIGSTGLFGENTHLRYKLDTSPRTVLGSVETTGSDIYKTELLTPLDIGATYASTEARYHVLCWQHDTGDNTLVGIDNLDTAAMASSTAGSIGYLAQRMWVGKVTGQYSDTIMNLPFLGYMLELLVFPTVLTQAQRRGVHLYLADKYSLAYGSGLTDEGAVAGDMVVEMKLDGSTWTDVTADVRANEGLTFSYGMDGTAPEDRVAPSGRCAFTMNNTATNSGGVIGYYSPDSTSCRTGFAIGLPVRVAFDYYGTRYYKWTGKVTDIAPSLDRTKRVTRVMAMDFMDELARTILDGIAVATDQRADEVLNTILSNMTRQPESYVLGTAADTYPYVFDQGRDESIGALGECQRIAISDLGFIYLRGDETAGGRFVFEPRNSRSDVVRWAIPEAYIRSMEITHTVDDVINRTILRLHPRRVDADATSVLFSLGNVPQILRGTSLTFTAQYRDPSGGRAVRVGGIDMVTPASTTDYAAYSTVTTSGTNRTSQLNVAATFGGNSAEVVVTNSGRYDCYLTKFQLRGKGIYSFEEVTVTAQSTASQDSYGVNTRSIDMGYQSNSNLAYDVASYIVGMNKDPRTRVKSVTIQANASSIGMLNALAREIGDRVSITETVSGLNAVEYFIQGVEFNVKAGSWIETRWMLIPADAEKYWLLEVAGRTELGVTTILGYSVTA